ncbi:TetR/AcrR family transcriptional regulator [Actinomadura verrucosospora]|uniref:TetR family transcriptional regulator n=1 Tax=Actinomadura verrucosospora TaxID=46165 RepID=A0A7D3VZQ3_ACTVE|nr:TetR/AcrR family transcriptional regulator [Actinomadura verrucosospora]QKG22976.1 TetR family transcriptional regulator [Actinomadura verrucosospora]
MEPRTDLLSGRPAGPPRERADAARNRAKVLAAAAGLFASRDPRTVTMDDIAKAAGVGRGTLYRRYPDTVSIARALLDDHERALQERLLRGDPPLGPGASPGDRLAAFYAAMVDLLEEHTPLVLGAEQGEARFAAGAYGFWRAHVRMLLSAAGTPEPAALADALLAPLAPDVYAEQRRQGLTPAQITKALTHLAHTTTTP